LHAVLLFASLVVATLACEGLLRLVGYSRRFEDVLPRSPSHPWIIYDPLVGRADRPGFEHASFRIDSLGFRGPEIARRKPPGTHRIVCLGDSTTFGMWRHGPWSNSYDVSYTDVLRDLLAGRRRAPTEVVNAGVLGYTSANGVRQLLARVLPLAPDVVTVRYGNNDHLLGYGAEERYLRDRPTLRVMRLLPTTLLDWQLVALGVHAYRERFTPADETRRRRLTPTEFARNLRHIIEIARGAGARVLLLDFPYRSITRRPPDERFPNAFTDARTLEELYEIHEAYQAIVREVATETGTPILETEAAVRAAPVPVFSDWDLSHPNRAGAELLGRLLLDRLDDLGWLPPTMPPAGT
jgi:lysophospholipase L1-like esterase